LSYLFVNINYNNMPRMDGTGPLGKGPMTGRGMGKCDQENENSDNRGFGRGRRFNGRGRSFGSFFSQKDQK
jgi:hypothetical protein